MFGIIRSKTSQLSLFLKHTKCSLQAVASIGSAPSNASETPETAETHVEREPVFSPDLRFKYPEFLPHPYIPWRNPIREKLERSDMLRRRANITIPEFYVGSVLAVTSSNMHAPTKTSKFVGICILRKGTGLCSSFLLRNVVDHQGIEVLYELYDPKLLKIEVLRLEKRLDNELYYLRDADPIHSTFSFDMEPEYLPEGEPVPINPIKIKLNPRPWRRRYEVLGLQGIEPIELSRRRKKRFLKFLKHKRPVEYDLMWQYRSAIPEEEQREIYNEIGEELQTYEIKRRKLKRRTEFIPPKKKA